MDYKNFFEQAKEKNITNIQVVEKTVIDSTVEILDGKIESYDDYNNVDYDIKAEYNGKTVKLNADYLDDETLNLIIEKCNITDSEYKDDYLDNNEKINQNKVLDFNIKNEIDKLIKIDNLREKYPGIKKLTTCFCENYTNTRIINSNGEDRNFTSYDEKVLTTNKEEIDFETFAENVIKKTLIICNKEKIESKKYNIILDRKVASRIIASFGQMLSATAVRNKVSCLDGKIAKKLFSDKLSVIEDPTNKDYPGYRLFDNEGTRTYKKEIIKAGVVKTYLYNIKEAILAETQSTANGYDSISTKNMYVIPGNISDEDLLKKLDNGIYIADYMESGGTSINSVNGNISLQVFGFIVEKGKLVSGIEPSILTSTIYELLSNIEEISSNLQFTSTSSASPSMLIRDISIAR